MTTKKALVLSGGGGRGAYHVGVLEALVEHGWMEDGKGPDIIAGTSIGAINAAALASGLTVAELKRRWLHMHTEQVHRLSDDLPKALRPVLRFLLRSVLTSESAESPPAPTAQEEHDLHGPGVLNRLSTLFHARPFRSLLDTTPWRTTLNTWMDFERINSPDAPALLLTATELQSGTLRVFCNRALQGRPPDRIRLEHLMASSSIPIVYPWTEIDGGKYWDGAVIANTPIEPVIALAGDASDLDIDIVVVMMTPWNTSPESIRAQTKPMPKDLVQGLSLTLDWALLASYRVAFELLEKRNQLAAAAALLDRAATQTGDTSLRLPNRYLRPIRLPTVIAPDHLMPLDWIIDYEDTNHVVLFHRGKADAQRALAERATASYSQAPTDNDEG